MKKLERDAVCRAEIAPETETLREAEAMRRIAAAHRTAALPESLLTERETKPRDALVPSEITKLITVMRLQCEIDKQYRVYRDLRRRGTRAEIKAQQAVINRLSQNLARLM